MAELKTTPSSPTSCCGGAAAAKALEKDSRRTWLFKVGIAFNVIAGALVGIPILGFVLSGLFNKKAYSEWIALGPIANYPEGNTRLASFKNPFGQSWDGQTGFTPCWVRRIEGEKFQVFAINCTHLGCPVRWFQESHLFMCPCHGGVFYEDGNRASGPPPRGLFEYKYKVENGQLMINGGHLPTLAQEA